MTEDQLIGKRLGEYQIEGLLGQGGMARVYRAVDVKIKRQAVLKLIDPPSRKDPGYVARFEREAQIIGRLDHPNIVRLYRFDEQDGWLYMAMQHIEGADLGVVLAGYRADKEFMDPDDARRIIREVCSALDYAHGQGVIHRDVKPANVLLDRQGHAFLADFGLALITAVGTRGEIFGSAHYIAPEQAVSSAKAVPQSDLYAIGIILYEIFTGDVPFKAATPLDIALLHISEPPVPPRQIRSDINPALEAVILKALAKKPEERFSTGAALLDALDRALDARSTVTLLAPNSSASHHTIPERVALELGQPPLPPIPAMVASAPPPADKLGISEPAVSPAKKRPLISAGVLVGLVAIVLLVLACFALIVLLPLANRFGEGNATDAKATETAQAVVSSTGLATTAPATPIAVAESSATSPVPLQPTASPAVAPPTAIPVSYQLLIVRGQGNDSVIVVNQSERAFPLELFHMGNDKQGLNGTEWGVVNLESGDCVVVWKENPGNAKRRLPEGLNCQLVGNQPSRDRKDWFGERDFAVEYGGKQYGICDKDQKQCLISIKP